MPRQWWRSFLVDVGLLIAVVVCAMNVITTWERFDVYTVGMASGVYATIVAYRISQWLTRRFPLAS